MDCFGTYFTHCTKLFEVLQNGLFCYRLFTQSRDNVRVERAMEWTASVHTSHMPKAVITFVFKMLLGALLNFRVFAFSCFPVFAFSRFRVFAFSRSRVFVFSCFRRLSPPVFAFSRFRVFVFRRRHPRGRDTEFVCTVQAFSRSNMSSNSIQHLRSNLCTVPTFGVEITAMDSFGATCSNRRVTWLVAGPQGCSFAFAWPWTALTPVAAWSSIEELRE